MFGVFSDSLVALCDTSVTNGKYLKFGIILWWWFQERTRASAYSPEKQSS